MAKITLPGVRVVMGEREMYLVKDKVPAAVTLIDQPSTWDPLAKQPHGNRVRDTHHVEAIRDYLINEEHPILNSIVVYPQNGAKLRWRSSLKDDPDTGFIEIDLGARLDVGDGQHRLAALSELVADYQHVSENNKVRRKLWELDLPMLLVNDTDPVRRAQDFADLQRNSKPPSGSLGASMDRRRLINDFAMEVGKSCRLLRGGERIEWQRDAIGKKSAKLYSFQAFRQAVGIVLIGSSERTRAGFEDKADAALKNDTTRQNEKDRIVYLFDGLGDRMPGFREITNGFQDVPIFRQEYLHSTAVGLYTICFALHKAREARIDVDKAIEAIAALDWTRQPTMTDQYGQEVPVPFGEGFFDNTLVIWDPKANIRKTGSGRPAWEAAGEKVYDEVVKPLA